VDVGNYSRHADASTVRSSIETPLAPRRRHIADNAVLYPTPC